MSFLTLRGRSRSLTITPGLPYQGEFSEDLVAWTPLRDPQTAMGANLNVLDKKAARSEHFYRVMIVP